MRSELMFGYNIFLVINGPLGSPEPTLGHLEERHRDDQEKENERENEATH